MPTEFAGQRADDFLDQAYPDPRQRAHAARWLGWIAQHEEDDGVI